MQIDLKSNHPITPPQKKKKFSRVAIVTRFDILEYVCCQFFFDKYFSELSRTISCNIRINEIQLKRLTAPVQNSNQLFIEPLCAFFFI